MNYRRNLHAHSLCSDLNVEFFFVCVCMGCVSPHGWVLCSDAQATQDVSFLTDGPQWNLLQPGLSQTRQDGDINKRDGWDFLPGSDYSNFTFPMENDDTLI